MLTHKSVLARQILLALVLALGAGTVWFVVAVWVGASIMSSWPKGSKPVRETLVVSTDGEPYVQVMPLDNLSQMKYRDLDGQDLSQFDNQSIAQAHFLGGAPQDRNPRLNRWGWPNRICFDELSPAAIWYLELDGKPDATGSFVGYERKSNRLIGYLGLKGFRSHSLPVEERIPVSSYVPNDYSESWTSVQYPYQYVGNYTYTTLHSPKDAIPPRLVHVPSRNRLRVIDLHSGTAREVHQTPEPIISVAVTPFSQMSGSESIKQPIVLLRTDKAIYKLDRQYQLVGTFTLPQDHERHTMVRWYESPDGESVVEYNLPSSTDPLFNSDRTRSAIFQLSQDGSVRTSREVELLSGQPSRSKESTYKAIAFALPGLIPMLVAEAAVSYSTRQVRFQDTLRDAFPWLAAVLTVSALLAALIWWRARTVGLGLQEQVSWVLFVLLLGLPGFFGVLLHRQWPKILPCPTCHQSSSRDHNACTRCGKDFPAPALKGTEVFS